ncbi:MAG: aspartate-semialdehyde dehydrogenase [Planctomycetes bacterium]|nr:aspartate-semialdehyde dehydrogenase [Planctomycetota bacterium]
MASPLDIAVVGATGAVGREFLDVLEQRRFPHARIRLLASARSAGTALLYRGGSVVIEELTERSFEGVKLALFSAGGSISKVYGPIAVDAGAVVVDNSSAFRMMDHVPLVVPEVNPEEAAPHRGYAKPGIIANPNCSTIIMLVAVNPIRAAFGVERLVISTYQAASGAGAAAMEELRTQTADVLAGRPAEPKVFKEPYAFNLFSHNSSLDPLTGRNQEEQKMIDESRKIWRDPSVKITATCIRVPVLRAHAESINITLKTPATEGEVREVLSRAPGVTILDDRAGNVFPTPLKASGRDDVFVGRIRGDESQASTGSGAQAKFHGFNLFVCGDQLRKGAALNAVQIAELL